LLEFKATEILILLINVVLGMILFFLLLAISRRLYNGARFRSLDKYRADYQPRLEKALADGTFSDKRSTFEAPLLSLPWQAVEDVLFRLIDKPSLRAAAAQAFQSLGYVQYYERSVKSGSVLKKALAINKLGRMRSGSSADLLLSMLDCKEPEIIASSVWALGNIGDSVTLPHIFSVLPDLFRQELISAKTVENALLLFGIKAKDILIEEAKKCQDPGILAIILEARHTFPIDEPSLDFAMSVLRHTDPEVRAKALKVIAASPRAMRVCVEPGIAPLLADPVWFVRLQAVRALGFMECSSLAGQIGHMVLDERWQVRRAAAVALTRLGDKAVETLLTLLRSSDRYARETVCEEIQKTDFIMMLIWHLTSPQLALKEKATEILRTMISLRFSSVLREMLETLHDEPLKKEIAALLREEPSQ